MINTTDRIKVGDLIRVRWLYGKDDIRNSRCEIRVRSAYKTKKASPTDWDVIARDTDHIRKMTRVAATIGINACDFILYRVLNNDLFECNIVSRIP